MMPRQAALIALPVFLLAALVTVVCAETAPQAPQAVSPADFLKDAGLQGKVALIQFGMIGCPLSEEGIVRMTALDKNRTIDGLSFARVELGDESSDSKNYFAAKSTAFTVRYKDSEALSQAFDASAVPTYVLVDKFGRVRYRGPWADEAKLAQWVAALGAETADAGPNAPTLGAPSVDTASLLDTTRLPDLESTVASLRERMGAKGLFAVFVDTKCPFSATAIKEMPTVASVLAKQDIKCLLVNIGEPESAVKEFYAAHPAGAPVVYDTTEATQTAWAITSVPTVIVMDAAGAPIYRGGAVWADVGAAIEKNLKLAAGTISFTVKGTGKG
jgi:thioredoxin-related protein